MTTKRSLHKELWKLRFKVKYLGYRPNGICLGVCKQSAYELQIIFPTWPKYSGNLAFPVPAQIENRYWNGPGAAYLATTPKQKWNKKTEYGQLRRELLDFLIKETR